MVIQDKIEKLPGVQGCFLSHYEIWKKCAEQTETFLICEHDGIFIRKLPEDVENHFEHVLNLDPYDHFNESYNAKVEKSLTLPINYPPADIRYKDKAGGYLPGAYGYLIKPEGARRLIKFALDKGALPTDKHIGVGIIDLKTTTVPIIRLHDFFNMKNLRKFDNFVNESFSDPTWIVAANEIMQNERLTNIIKNTFNSLNNRFKSILIKYLEKDSVDLTKISNLIKKFNN
jgi:GR25 family glycosyltransferase involved in LPS biosynthesis